MLQKKKIYPKEKARLHPRNQHRERYDFKLLIKTCHELAKYVKLNNYNDESIDFFNPDAVKMLNKALLKQYYNIEFWDIPDNYLCPPIPGRADYIHHIADVLGGSNFGKIPTGEKVKCLDIGVGANCVYPIIGVKEYGWSFIGSDINSVAIESANKIVETNSNLKGKVECRLQIKPKDFFYSIISKDEIVDITICNPPFHSSEADAKKATHRKFNNLVNEKNAKPILNFGGNNNELCYNGGEERFVRNMARESKKFSNNCFWFSSLVSKQSSLKSIYNVLTQLEATEVKTIAMGQGNKTSRIVAWTFLTKPEQLEWKNKRWKNNS